MKPTVTNYKKLLKKEPTNREALDFLEAHYAKQQKWHLLFALYSEVARDLAQERPQEIWERLLSSLIAICEQEGDAPTRQEVLCMIAEIYSSIFSRGDLAAERLYDALALGPCAKAWDALADLYSQNEVWSEAAAIIEEQLGNLSDDQARVAAMERLAKIQDAHLGDRDAALSSYRAIVELDSGHPRALGALAAVGGGAPAESGDDAFAAEIDESLPESLESDGGQAPTVPPVAAVKTEKVARKRLKEARAAQKANPENPRIAECLAEAFEADPQSNDVRVFFEAYHEQREEWTALTTYYLRLAELAPTEQQKGEHYLNAALCMENDGLPEEEVLPTYLDAYRRRGDDQALLNKLVEAYSASESWEALLRVYEIALDVAANEEERLPIYVQLAMIYWKKLEDLVAAERVFRRIRSLQPKHPLVTNFYETYYRHQDDWLHLSTTLEKKLRKSSGEEQVQIALELAQIAIEQLNNEDKAIMALTSAMANAPDHPQLQAQLCELYERTGRWHALLEILHRQIDALDEADIDGKIEIYFKMIAIYQDPQKLPIEEMVINTYNKIVALSPTNIAALDSLAQKYEGRARWQELVNVLQKKVDATEDADTLLELFQRIATLWVEHIQNPAQAIPALEEILRLDPNNLEVVQKLRRIYKQKHDVEHVYDTYRAELALDPDGSSREEILFELAVLATEKLGRLDEGATYWRELFDLNPNHQRAFDALSSLLETRGDWDAVVALYGQRIANSHSKKRTLELYQTLAQTLTNVGQDGRAAAVLLVVLDIEPTNEAARTSLRQIYVREQAWDKIEMLYEQHGDWEGYVTLLEELQDREADLARRVAVNMRIVEICDERLRQPERAVRYLERIWQLEPENQESLRRLIAHYRAAEQWESLLSANDLLAQQLDDPQDRRDLLVENIRVAEESLANGREAFNWCCRQFVADAEGNDLTLLGELTRLADGCDGWHELMIVLKDALDSAEDDHARVELAFQLAETAKNHLFDPDESVKYYEMVLEWDERHVGALRELEGLYAGTFDVAGLKRILSLKLALDLDPDERRLAIEELSGIYESEEEIAPAIACFRQMLELQPGDSIALAGLKRMYERVGDHDALIATMAQELRFAGGRESVELKYEMGRVFQQQLGDLPRAVDTYIELLNECDSHEPTFDALEALLTESSVEERIAYFLERYYRERHDDERIALVLSVQLEHASERTQRMALLAELETLYGNTLGDSAQTYRVLRERFVLEPTDETLWERLTRIGKETEQLRDVIAAFNWAAGIADAKVFDGEPIADDPQRRRLMFRIAELQSGELMDPRAATVAYEAAHDLEPSDVVVLDQLSVLYRAQTLHEKLLDVLRQRLELTYDANEKVSRLIEVCALLEDDLERFEETLPYYEQVLQFDPRNEASYEALERSHREAGRWDELVELLRRRLGYAEGPEEQTAAHLMVASVFLMDLQQIEEAAREYITVLAIDPAEADARAALEAILDEKSHPGYDLLADDVVNVLAPLYEAEGNWDALVRLNAEILLQIAEHRASDYDQFVVLNRVGQLYQEKLGDMQRAFGYFCLALRTPASEPETVERVYRLGMQLGEYQALADVLAETVQPHETKYLYLLGDLFYTHLSDSERAEGYFRRSLASDRLYADAIYPLEVIYAAQGDHDNLIDIMRRKVEICEEARERRAILFQIAEKLDGLGRYDDAISVFHEVLEQGSPAENELYVPALMALQAIYQDQEDWPKIVETYVDLAKVVDDTAAKVHYLMNAARTEEEKLQDFRRSISIYQTIHKLQRENVAAVEALERLYEKTEQWDQLVTLLDERAAAVEKVASRHALMHRMSQVVQVRQGDVERAVEILAEILAEVPDHRSALESLNTLVDDVAVGRRVLSVLHDAYAAVDEAEELVRVKRLMVDVADGPAEQARLYEEIAELYENALNDTSAALTAYGSRFRLRPDDSQGLAHLTDLAARVGDWQAYISLLTGTVGQVEALDDRVRLWKALAAVQLEHERDPDAAAATYETIRAELPHDLETLLALEAIYESQERHDELLSVLRSKLAYLADVDAKVDALRKCGRLLRDTLDRPEEAIEPLNEVIVLSPAELFGYDELAALLAQLDKWESLIEVLRRKDEALDEDQAGRAENLQRIVDVLLNELDRPEAAFADAQQALAIATSPAAVESLERIQGRDVAVLEIADLLIPVYEAQESWDKLIAAYQLYSDELSDPAQRVDWLEKRAHVEEHVLGRMEKALETRCAQVRLQPANMDNHARLFRLAGDTEQWARLVELYGELLGGGHAPELICDFHLKLALLQNVYLQQPEVAIEHYRAVLEHDQTDKRAITELTQLYLDLEKWAEMVALRERLVDNSPDVAEKREQLMEIAALWRDKLGAPDEAVEAFRRLLDVTPDDRQAFEGLDALYLATEKWEALIDLLDHRLKFVDDRFAHCELQHRKAMLLAEQTDRYDEAIAIFEELLAVDTHRKLALSGLEGFVESLSLLGVEHAAEIVRATDLLERQYDPQRHWKKLIDVLAIELNFRDDRHEKIALLQRIVGLHRRYGSDFHAAFDQQRSAVLLDFARDDLREELRTIAEAHSLWEAYVETLKQGAEAAESDLLKEQIWFHVAQVLDERLHRGESAAQFYGRVRALNASHSGALDALEASARAQSNYEALVSVLQDKIALCDTAEQRRAIQHELAEIAVKKFQDEGGAIELYRIVLGDDPTDATSQRELEKLLRRGERWSELVDLYQGRLEREGRVERRLELLMLIASVHEQCANDLGRAVNTYLQAQVEVGDNPVVLDGLDRLYSALSEWEKLIEVLERKTDGARDLQREALVFRIAELCRDRLGQHERALDHLRVIVERNSAHDASLRVLREMLDEPSVRFQAALILEPIYRERGETQRLNHVLEIQLEHVDSRSERIVLLQQLYQLNVATLHAPEVAWGYLKDAYLLMPDNEELAGALEHHAAAHQNWEQLGAAYEAALPLLVDPDHAKSLNVRLAELYERDLDLPQEAIAHFQRVLAFDEFNPHSLSALERLYEKAGQWSDLCRVLRTKMELSSGDDALEIRFRLAEIYRTEVNDPATALGLYEQILFENPDYGEAIRAMEQLADSEAFFPTAARFLEPFYERNKRWQRLTHLLQRKINLMEGSGERTNAHIKLAEINATSLNNKEEAFAHYMDALEENPTRVVILDSLEELAQRLNNWGELVNAVEALHLKVKGEPQFVTYLVRLGRWYKDKLRDYPLAEEKYTTALRNDDDSEEVITALEEIYKRLDGKIDSLVEIYERKAERAVEVKEKKRIYYQIAQLSRELGDDDKAVTYYDRLLTLDNTERRALEALDRIHTAREDWHAVASVLERKSDSLSRKEEVVGVKIRLAKLRRQKLDQVAQAIETYEEVMADDQTNRVAIAELKELYTLGDAWAKLSWILKCELEITHADQQKISILYQLAELAEKRLDDPRAAIGFLTDIQRIDVDEEDSIDELIRLYRVTASWNALIEAYQVKIDGCESLESRYPLWITIAEIYSSNLRDDAKASEALDRILDFDKKNIEALTILAEIRKKSEDWRGTADVLERIVNIAPEHQRARENYQTLGQLYEQRLGDSAKAEQYYQRILAISPGDGEGFAALSRLYRARDEPMRLWELLDRRVKTVESVDEQVLMLKEMALIARSQLRDVVRYVECAERILLVKDDEIKVVQALIDTYLDREEFERATSKLEWMVDYLRNHRMFKELHTVAHQLGGVWERLGEAEKAIKFYRIAHQQLATTNAPTYIPNLIALGRLLMAQEELDEALKVYQPLSLKAARITERSVKVELWHNLGRIMLQKDNPGRAKEYLNRALSVDRNHEPTKILLEALNRT